MNEQPANLTVDTALAELRARHAARNPKSAASFARAGSVLPGGSTRSVLYYEPFPLTLARGEGAEVEDIDGHRYVDFVGEFSAGLYGHSDPVIKAAIVEALDQGVVLAAPTLREQELAFVIASRFPSMELLRFCNSGTEANVLAIATAVAVTERKKILAFRDAYHGGVLVFSSGGGPLNVPYEFIIADFNDTEGAADLIRRHGDALAAVIVEPILGAAGNFPGTPEFLRALRQETQRVGALLIFDEVKTSRCGPGGLQGELGIVPDLTTLGKYIGGGLPSGAFGGRREIMQRFDLQRPQALRHAGTFNNNVCSMAAGLAGLTRVFPPARARDFLASGEQFRQSLNALADSHRVPMRFVGMGSLFTAHFVPGQVRRPSDVPAVSRRLAQIFHMECAANGVLVAGRGDVFMSLPMEERHRQQLSHAVSGFINAYKPLLERELARTHG